MIGKLLQWLPGWLTGRIEPRARREVKGWIKNNATLRTLKYGFFRRFLMWSAGHPIFFAVSMGVVAAGVAYVIAGQQWGFVPRLAGPDLDEKFDPATYTGVPWSVQATLVALVYPIVLSFIALMLQRRAHSAVALRVYVLDSGVIPAGASSIGLLLVMGGQYFAAPYSTPCFLANYMAPLLLMNGTWFAGNLFLTGLFLTRTIRFIQEEEQRHAYTRLAVDVVLRAELTAAVKQHIYVNAPYADWGLPVESVDSSGEPQVRMLSLGGERPAVRRDVKGSLVLHDVHLHLLKLVVRSWTKRARQRHQGGKPALICFPPRVGQVATGAVVLCSIENGPALTIFERMLVRIAFCYQSSRKGRLSLSTKMMLEEIGGEVEAAVEQRRFGVAEDGLRNVIQLHETLLRASAADSQGGAESAATIGTSPYAWGESSFDIEWLKPYREIGRIAVNSLDEDLRLFRLLAVVPARIAAELPPKPEKLIIDAMMVGTNLFYQLGGWWTRKADASLMPGATSFSGTLPAPLSKVYEQALVAFVGSWGHVRIRISESDTVDVQETWEALTARALAYANHIEKSAELLLKAVSRGDEAASCWLLDNFLKWWGNRQHELEHGDPDDFQLRHATLSLADKTWREVQCFLADGETQVTVDLAGKALNLGIRRYWESMRLYVALLLIQYAGLTPTADCRELRLAAALIKGTAQKRGGNVECWPLDNVDAVTTAVLGAIFGNESVVNRIDGFAEKLRWDNEAPEVSGWIYSWSGSPTDLNSMKQALATLLVALAKPPGHCVRENKKLIESWWKDLDKLESVARYCQDMRCQVLSQEFGSATPVVTVLQSYLGTTTQSRSGQLVVARTMKELHRAAVHERLATLRVLDVDEDEVQRLAEKIAIHAFGPLHWPSLLGTSIAFVPTLEAYQGSITFEYDKTHFVAGTPHPPDSGFAEHIAEYVRHQAVGWAFSRRVAEIGVVPTNTESLRNDYDATDADAQTFISSVVRLCSDLRSAGENPVVLVGQGTISSYLRTYKWGAGYWQYQLPAGITLRNADQNKGESAMAFINEAPVYQFDTPNGDCYVVPSSLVRVFEVCGSDMLSALNIKWTQVNHERLKFVASWKARFSTQKKP